jgi:fatty-acyl-CoA synthase
VVRLYIGNPEATARAFTDDGWFRSGDLGEMYADGSFVYLARLKDSLRLRGFLTDPAEIEQRFLLHPGVAAASVVGVPGPDGADVAVAFIVLGPAGPAGDPPTEGDLIEHCREGLANYKIPVRVGIVEAFPVVDGPNGIKILKSELREWALAFMADEGGAGRDA